MRTLVGCPILVSCQTPRYYRRHIVAKYLVPGLKHHPSHQLAKKYLPRGYGGVLSFGVKGGEGAGSQVVDGFKLISNLAKYVSLPNYLAFFFSY